MKRIITIMSFLIFPLIGFGQSYYYNFDEDGNEEGFTQGGIPSMNVTGGALVATDDPTTYTGGFQQIRTAEGLNLDESNYTMVRLVVENLLVDNTGAAANHELFRIVNYDTGDQSPGNGTQTANLTIPYGAGFQTLDFAIPSNPDNAGIIDRIGLRVQLNSAANLSGTLRIDQFIILNTVTVNIATNGDFENNGGELTPWVANGSDVSASLTTGNGGGSAGRLTFDQNATTNNTLENSFYTFTANQTIQTSTVTVNFDAKKSSAGAVSVGIQTTTKLNGSDPVNKFNGNNTVTGSWASYSTNRSVDPFDEIRVSLRVKNNDASASLGDTFDFDNVVVNVTYYDLKPAIAASKTDGNWSSSDTWIAGYIPTSSDNVVINHDLINDTNANTNNLTINSGGSLVINAGNSLIVGGTSTGNVTYNRTLTSKPANADGWHLVSSPVAGEIFDNDYVTNNSIASGSGSNLGIATYSSSWTYLQSPSGSISSTSGIGYSMKRSADGTIGFTGTINTADVNGVAVSASATDFVLLGVPFTSYMSSDTFLTANANLDQSQIWVWEQGTTGGSYIANTAKADNFILAPGQGFFVKKANTDATVNFAESNQQSNADTFRKSSRTEVKLLVNDGKIERFAKMYYLNNVTKGYDLGYEGETFGGVETNFDVFSHLVAEDQGKNYQVQSLPLSEMESTIVPLGLKVSSDQEVTISAEILNLPTGLKVYLEDRLTNTFTRLDEANTNYKVQVASGTTEGRFYLHTNSGALSTDTALLNSVSIYKSNATTLRIVGLLEGEASVKLFNLLGKQVMASNFNTTGVKELTLPNLSMGVYIVQLETVNGKLNKKIVLE